jgi:hypothetical protein
MRNYPHLNERTRAYWPFYYWVEKQDTRANSKERERRGGRDIVENRDEADRQGEGGRGGGWEEGRRQHALAAAVVQLERQA